MKESVLHLASFESTTDHLFDASFHGLNDPVGSYAFKFNQIQLNLLCDELQTDFQSNPSYFRSMV